MAHWRLEAVLNNLTNLYSLEAFYPADSTTPLMRTKPRFSSEQEAYDYFKERFSEAFPDKESAKDLKPN